MATLMCSSHLPWFHHQDNIWWRVHIMMLLIMQSSPFPCYFLLLSPIYFPQHPILKHRQPVSFPWYEGPNFTPISDNWQKPQLDENFCFCSVYPLCTVRMTWRADMFWVLLRVMYRSITLSVLFGAFSFGCLCLLTKFLHFSLYPLPMDRENWIRQHDTLFPHSEHLDTLLVFQPNIQ